MTKKTDGEQMMPVQPKLDSEKIWDEIKSLPIQMFGLPNQVVSLHCTPVIVEPNNLYLTLRSPAALPSIEVAIGDNYTVELVTGYVVVKRAVKLPIFPPRK